MIKSEILYILILFIGYNVTNKWGLNYNIFTVFLLFYSLMLFIFQKKRIDLCFKRNLFLIIIFVLIYGYIKLQSNNYSSTMLFNVLNIIATPICLLSIPFATKSKLNNQGIKSKINSYKTLVVFYITIVTIALLERIIKQHFFPWSPEVSSYMQYLDASMFRSNAFHGHPLQNALIVATIMNFILISKIPFKYKYLGWSAGLISLMCFNTRASIAISSLFFCIHLIYTLSSKKEKLKTKRYLLIVAFIIFAIGIKLITNTSLGGRLAENGLMDDSAQVRLDVWSIFNYYPIKEFLFGLSNVEDVDIIMHQAGLYATENFIIDWFFSFGVIFVLILAYLYIRFVTKLYKRFEYSTYEAYFTCLNFLMISGTNNSLSASFVPLFNYIFCIYVFAPIGYISINIQTNKYL